MVFFTSSYDGARVNYNTLANNVVVSGGEDVKRSYQVVNDRIIEYIEIEPEEKYTYDMRGRLIFVESEGITIPPRFKVENETYPRGPISRVPGATSSSKAPERPVHEPSRVRLMPPISRALPVPQRRIESHGMPVSPSDFRNRSPARPSRRIYPGVKSSNHPTSASGSSVNLAHPVSSGNLPKKYVIVRPSNSVRQEPPDLSARPASPVRPTSPVRSANSASSSQSVGGANTYTNHTSLYPDKRFKYPPGVI